MVASKIIWDHNESWIVSTYGQIEMDKSAERIVKLNIGSPDFEFIAGHCIDGL